jgi:hypothetical protein
VIRTAWTRKGLAQQREESQEMARHWRSEQVAAADGTPQGEQDSAQARTWADQEEERAARAGREARRPGPVRLPVRPAPYVREGDRADRRAVRAARRERRRGGEA